MATLKGKFRQRNIWTLFLLLIISAFISIFYYHSLQEQNTVEIKHLSTFYAERTENVINSIFHKTDTLAAVVKLQNGNITEQMFKDVAQLVYAKNSGIRGIQYMPGAVVTYSYPIEGNEAVIGKNFFNIPERRKDVDLAINTRSIALSGPYHLLQGGLGVVARNPIFLTDTSGKEYFWGFSAIILDLPAALNGIFLNQIIINGYDFQLFCINENNERLVIDGNPRLDLTKAVSTEIKIPHHTWTLAVTQLNPLGNIARACLLFFVCAIISFVLWFLYSQMQQKEMAINAKDRFFSDISHDMRTPLNGVIGFATLAQGPKLTAKEKDAYLAKIQSSGNLLLNLINDTLTVSKADSGKLHLNLVNVSVPAMLASIIDPLRIQAERKGITFTLNTEEYKHTNILADSLTVEKVCLNVINNAIRFTPKDGHVWVTIQNGKQHADMLITIKDDGIGISPNFLPHLYEPFAQEQRSGYEGTGTGLGLSIVKKLIDLMGGTISVDTAVGHGTTFTIVLPFQEAEATQVIENEQAAKDADFTKLLGKKILLCEDNKINTEIACALLKRKGVITETAANGAIGLEKFKNSQPGTYSAILMDLRMPVMDGFEATRAIRRLDRLDAKAIPIIAMTADVFPETIAQCLKASMNNHIGKPINPGQMFAILLKHLK